MRVAGLDQASALAAAPRQRPATPSVTANLLVVAFGLAACTLPGAEAVQVEASSSSALRAGSGTGTFWQWLFGWGRHEQAHHRAEFKEWAALGWKEASDKAYQAALQMSPEEQLTIVAGAHNLDRHYYVGNTKPFPKLGVPALRMQDSSNGYRTIDEEEWNTTTHWPSPLALGATWDEDIIGRTATAIAREFKLKGANVLLGPSLNVHRAASNGRNFEYMAGEDPYLGSRYAMPYIRAVQRQGVLAVAKHFAFNEQETNRYIESSDVDATTAWNIYYPPFESAVQAGVGSFMCSYNRVNGTPACGNPNLIRRDLRGTMGFKGFVMSDWMATHSPTDMLAGLDQEMNVGNPAHFKLETYTEFGPVRLAEATRAVLTPAYRLGLDKEENGCAPPCNQKFTNARSTKHSALAREAATASVVLLKNNGSLPLRAGPKKRLAIVGLPASARRGEASSRCPTQQLEESQKKDYWACRQMVSADYYGGGGSGAVVGPDPLTAVEAIRERASSLGIEVVNYTTPESMENMSEEELAPRVDAVLFFAATTSVESIDRPSLALDDHADRLISRFSKMVPTVVCMQTPGAVLTPWRDEASAIANLFLAGEETAHAWAAVLFGDHTPEGKLPIALPATKDDQILPGKTPTVPYAEGLWTSYRSMRFKWAFPFGHGLSYTTFTYGQPQAILGGSQEHQASEDCNSVLCVRVPVSNTGAFAGREVVQAYLQFPRDVGYPKMLRNFQKTEMLQPGKRTTVSLDFSERDLSLWILEDHGAWVPQRQFILHIGSSSQDIRRMMNITRPLPQLVGKH